MQHSRQKKEAIVFGVAEAKQTLYTIHCTT